jgi:hypothetical protein
MSDLNQKLYAFTEVAKILGAVGTRHDSVYERLRYAMFVLRIAEPVAKIGRTRLFTEAQVETLKKHFGVNTEATN